MSELKACPFCGRKSVKVQIVDGWKTVICGYCGASVGRWNLEAESVKEWNTRPIESALQSELTTAQEENKRYKLALESLFGHSGDEGLQEFYTRAYRLVDSLRLIQHHDDNPEIAQSALNGGK